MTRGIIGEHDPIIVSLGRRLPPLPLALTPNPLHT